MSTISTFGAFTTARLGMTASMMGLNVTGNNIANINTPEMCIRDRGWTSSPKRTVRTCST